MSIRQILAAFFLSALTAPTLAQQTRQAVPPPGSPGSSHRGRTGHTSQVSELRRLLARSRKTRTSDICLRWHWSIRRRHHQAKAA